MENLSHATDASSGKLKYLTVQDILWINLQVTKKVQHFNYAKLEEATYYQYGYGSSRDLPRQAGRFLSGFMKLRPLDAGNEATAFVGFVAFLLMNGMALNLEDASAAQWLSSVRTGAVRPEEQLEGMVTHHETAHDPIISDVRDSVNEALRLYPNTIAALSTEADTRLAG